MVFVKKRMYNQAASQQADRQDYAAYLSKGAYLTLPSIDAYNFGIKDFTITALFQTSQPGTLMSRIGSTEAGSNSWSIVVQENGQVRVVFWAEAKKLEIVAGTTKNMLTDNCWHSIALRRNKVGFDIFIDGKRVQIKQSGNLSSVDIKSSSSINIGFGDYKQLSGSSDEQSLEELQHFEGTIEDVSFWMLALNDNQVKDTMFNKIPYPSSGGHAPGLVGYWDFNKTFNDSSSLNNTADPIGSILWVPVFHSVWTESENAYSYCSIELHSDYVPDYGTKIDSGGVLVTSDYTKEENYNFGNGGFSFAVTFKTTQPGVLISRISNLGGDGRGGWVLHLCPNGCIEVILFDSRVVRHTPATNRGIRSNNTKALDGQWHNLVVATGRLGWVIRLDGVQIVTRFTYTADIDISSRYPEPIIIGDCKNTQAIPYQPYRQFNGIIDDVAIWNRMLLPDEISCVQSNKIEVQDYGLVGYWKMDQNFEDSSHVGNKLNKIGDIEFVKISHNVFREQKLNIQEGTPYLYGGVIDHSKSTYSFPKGAIVKIIRPDGSELNQEVNTDELFVHIKENSVAAFAVKDPQPGYWKFSLQCPTSVPLLLNIQTVPNYEMVNTIGKALGELYDKDSFLALSNDEQGACAPHNSIFSPNVLPKAGLALTILTVVATPLIIGTAGFTAPVAMGLATTLGVGQIMLGAAESEPDITATSVEVSKMIEGQAIWKLYRIVNNNFFGDIEVIYLVRGGETSGDIRKTYSIPQGTSMDLQSEVPEGPLLVNILGHHSLLGTVRFHFNGDIPLGESKYRWGVLIEFDSERWVYRYEDNGLISLTVNSKGTLSFSTERGSVEDLSSYTEDKMKEQVHVTESNYDSYVKSWILMHRRNIEELNAIARGDLTTWEFIQSAPSWFYLPWLPISFAELFVLIKNFPTDFISVAFSVKEINQKARDFRRDLWPQDLTQKNALRHTYWMALVTRKHGAQFADDLGNAHEYAHLDLTIEGPFDLISWPKTMGASIGHSTQTPKMYKKGEGAGTLQDTGRARGCRTARGLPTRPSLVYITLQSSRKKKNYGYRKTLRKQKYTKGKFECTAGI